MKKGLLTACMLLGAFGLGFAFNKYISAPQGTDAKHKRVTGIGGIFFKCKDPAKLREWYKEHLGLNTNPYGSVFAWYQGADSTKKGFLQWSPFKETTKYFQPSTKEFMINYRVEHMDELVAALKQEGVTVLDTVETFSYGKFVHIMDLEGNKLELWEPYDEEYGKMGTGVTK